MKKKIKKRYIEKFYPRILSTEVTVVAEVEDRSPMKVENDGKMHGFRFFDEYQVVDGDKVFNREKVNVSNWIFFGKRITLEELKLRCDNNPKYDIFIRNVEVNHYDSICLTQLGDYFIMSDGDVTWEEYFFEHNRIKKQLERLR